MTKTHFNLPEKSNFKTDNVSLTALTQDNLQIYYDITGSQPQYVLPIRRKSLQMSEDELIEIVGTMLKDCEFFSMLLANIWIYNKGLLLVMNFSFTDTFTEEHETNAEAWFENFKDYVKDHKDEKRDTYSFHLSFLFSEYAHDDSEIGNIVGKLKKTQKRVDNEKEEERSFINIVRTTQKGDLATMKKELKKQEQNFGVDELYNDDFIDVNARILAEIDEKSKGLVLLHGDPGTGKTSYVKYMISKIKKNVIYMPPMLAPSMAQPSFMSFLIDSCEDSVIVIEDAENVLKERESGSNDAVSNILNTTDGMLGDALNIQFVCTFNCDVDFIDRALFRPGRLIEQYKFDKLKREKAEKLLRKYYNNDEISATSDMTLGEIFNYNEILNPVENEKKQGFGFMNTK